MPCPEKFKESLIEFGVSEKIISLINEGYENIVSKSPINIKANYFQRAIKIMDEKLDKEKVKEILMYNACCTTGSRLKASKAFAKANKDLSLEEKISKIKNERYMGNPILNDDGTITVNAVQYMVAGKFHCACSNFNKLKQDFKVSKTYCYCCGGHFIFHYEIMLGVKLRIKDIISSPLDSEGNSPCAFLFEIAI